MTPPPEVPNIQRTYDLPLWYVPLLNKLPQDSKLILGDRIQNTLYTLLEGLIRAEYRCEGKAELLESLNAELDVLRFQTRLCLDFELLSLRRYEHVSRLVNEVGVNLCCGSRHPRSQPHVDPDTDGWRQVSPKVRDRFWRRNAGKVALPLPSLAPSQGAWPRKTRRQRGSLA